MTLKPWRIKNPQDINALRLKEKQMPIVGFNKQNVHLEKVVTSKPAKPRNIHLDRLAFAPSNQFFLFRWSKPIKPNHN